MKSVNINERDFSWETSKNKQTDVSKWIERISQSKRALR